MAKTRVGVLISGRGSNLQALIEAAAVEDYPAEIALVVSNRPNAPGLKHADAAGIARKVVNHRRYEDRARFDAAIDASLREAKVDYVCLAGFMRILTDDFVRDWRGRILNIHPSLLPAFKGLHVQERMIEAGVKIAGCTVHFVSAEMDAGPVIGQAAVKVLPGDDADALAARILKAEHKLYPACLKAVVEGTARLSGGLVMSDAPVRAGAPMFNPPIGRA
ncbi:MAG: phosphoribosylglycinamide formyltransferase [Parvularculaceae bacterium]